MKRIRRQARGLGTRTKRAREATPAKRKRPAKPKSPAVKPVQPSVHGGAPRPQGPTLRSQAQLEIRFGRGERALTAIEQAARLASAQMERRIGRLLSRRVKLTFRREAK